MNLCPLCKSKHNNDHKIYNYDKLNIICNKHNELKTNYCNDCKKIYVIYAKKNIIIMRYY